MMINPENYYEDLKGKSIPEIETAIVELKDSIERNKSLLENFKLGVDEVCFPYPNTQIIFIKNYLEAAKQALHEAGGEYKPTKAEKKRRKLIKTYCILIRWFYGSVEIPA